MRLSPDRRGRTPDLAHEGPCGMNRKIKTKSIFEFYL